MMRCIPGAEKNNAEAQGLGYGFPIHYENRNIDAFHNYEHWTVEHRLSLR